MRVGSNRDIDSSVYIDFISESSNLDSILSKRNVSVAKDNKVVQDVKEKGLSWIFFPLSFSLVTPSILELSRLILCKTKCKILGPFNIEIIACFI